MSPGEQLGRNGQRERRPHGRLSQIAGVCGLAAFVVFNIGWIAGGIAQPNAYSSVRDDTSDLGAVTAHMPWLYNQVAANLTGLLVIVLGIGLWWALSPSILGRVGAAAVVVTGLGTFLDGVFRLDCRGIDTHCTNDSWHAHAHKIESGVTGASLFLAPIILALAFRRDQRWRPIWLPSLLAVPVAIAVSVLFSFWGDGAATRAATVALLLWLALISLWLLLLDPVRERVRTSSPA